MVEALVREGDTVHVETEGKGSSFSDKDYESEGAIVLKTAKEVCG